MKRIAWVVAVLLMVAGQAQAGEVLYTPWEEVPGSADTWTRSRTMDGTITKVIVRVPQQLNIIEYYGITTCHDINDAGEWVALPSPLQKQTWTIGPEMKGEVIGCDGLRFDSEDPAQLVTDFGIPTRLVDLARKYMDTL